MKPELEKHVTVRLNVPYRRCDQGDLCLDAVLVRSERPTPVVVSIHGGGWKTGTKDGFSPLLSELVAAGISWVSLDYRMATEAVFPAQVKDCTYALQFVKSKAKEWNIDPDRVALEGHSAGGHLSLWVGLHPDQADPASPDPVRRHSTKVAAIVNRAGPVDFSLLDTVRHEAHEFVYLLLGHAYDGREKDGSPGGLLSQEQIRSVSPITYVSADSPPVFTIHGTADPTVPVQHGRNLEAALRKHHVPCQVHYIENGNHDTWYEGLCRDSIDFLKRHLLATP